MASEIGEINCGSQDLAVMLTLTRHIGTRQSTAGDKKGSLD